MIHLPSSRHRRLASLFAASALLLPALSSAQAIVGWGNDGNGQLDPTSDEAYVLGIAAGTFHSLAVKADGTVMGFGWNFRGQSTPPVGLTGVVQVAGGYLHSMALKSNGKVVAWGDNTYGQTTIPSGLTGVTQIATGGYYSLALKSNGTVVAWGNDGSGQTDVPAGLATTVQISAATYNALALKSDGTVVGWGDNAYGQLNVPAGLMNVVQVAAGAAHSLALKSDGTVVAWGDDSVGQTDIPAGLDGVIAIAAGDGQSLALKSDGTVVGWGASGTAAPPAGLAGVVAIAAGGDHSLAARAEAYATLDQTQLPPGYSATGTVTLAKAAPSGGKVVPLSVSDPSLSVPASVTVPAGATTKTFPVTTNTFFGADRTVVVKTNLGSPTVPTSVLVTGNEASATLSLPNVIGGSTSRSAFTLNLDSAPLVDTVFDLSSSDPSVTLPATITVKAGMFKAFVYPTVAIVPTDRTAVLSVKYAGSEIASASLGVKALNGALTFLTYSLTGGYSTNGSVTLNANVAAPLTLTFTTGSLVSMPATVTIPANSKAATFIISSTPVAQPTFVPVSTVLNGKTLSVNLRLNPQVPLQSLTVPTYLYGSQRVTCTVILKADAPGEGASIFVTSSDPSVIVPSSVTITAGGRQATFEIEGADVASVMNATITASHGASQIVKSTQVRPLALSALSLSYASVTGGATVSGSVTLNVPVSVDTVVSLASDNPAVASVPATVTVPAGSKTATFTVTTYSLARAKNVKITATKNATSLYRTLKVNP